MLEAFDWGFLPYPGSLLEQPDGLMSDLLTWRWLKGIVEAEVNAKTHKV